MSTLICPLAADIGLYMWCVKESSFRRKRGTERIRSAPTTCSYLQTTSTSSIPEPIQSPTPYHIFSISLCYLFAQTLRYLPPTKRVTVVRGWGVDYLHTFLPPSMALADQSSSIIQCAFALWSDRWRCPSTFSQPGGSRERRWLDPGVSVGRSF